jgi:hypothetical protein
MHPAAACTAVQHVDRLLGVACVVAAAGDPTHEFHGDAGEDRVVRPLGQVADLVH